jgi:transcriptional regulator with GAF, ATPase, and Fis domain
VACLWFFDTKPIRVVGSFVEPYNSKLETGRLALENVPREETAAWWVYQNQEPVVVRLTVQETHFPRMLDRLAILGHTSSCIVPLSTAHRKLGSLAFASRLEHAYSPDEQRFLSLVANKIAVAIDDARAQAAKATPSGHKSLQDTLDYTEQTEILRALEASNGIIAGPGGAAARLGLKRSTLQLRMQKLGIRLSRTPHAERGRTAG